MAKGGKTTEAPGQAANDRTAPPCPICGQPARPRNRPFCSGRCADLDLHRWLSGGYRIETEERPGPEDWEQPGGLDLADDGGRDQEGH